MRQCGSYLSCLGGVQATEMSGIQGEVLWVQASPVQTPLVEMIVSFFNYNSALYDIIAPICFLSSPGGQEVPPLNPEAGFPLSQHSWSPLTPSLAGQYDVPCSLLKGTCISLH